MILPTETPGPCGNSCPTFHRYTSLRGRPNILIASKRRSQVLRVFHSHENAPCTPRSGPPAVPANCCIARLHKQAKDAFLKNMHCEAGGTGECRQRKHQCKVSINGCTAAHHARCDCTLPFELPCKSSQCSHQFSLAGHGPRRELPSPSLLLTHDGQQLWVPAGGWVHARRQRRHTPRGPRRRPCSRPCREQHPE